MTKADRIAKAIKFIRAEYSAQNEDGDLIPDPLAREIYSDLIDVLFELEPDYPLESEYETESQDFVD